MTSSSPASLMPRTPVEVRPAKTRTSGTAKRMHLPSRVASSTSCSSVQVLTSRSAARLLQLHRDQPLERILAKSDSRLRRTVPPDVANIRWN
jgi:hypothetical protein